MKTDVIQSRVCPVCGSAHKDLVFPIEFKLFDGHPMDGGYNLVQCNACGFVYADIAITQDDLDLYYAELSKYEDKTISTGGGFTQNDKNRLVDTARFIGEQIANKELKVLDLGCANGGLLQELKNIGFNNLTGVDPSAVCVDITRKEVGCDCFHYSLFDIPENFGKYDIIVSTHVLEHLLNVREAVAVMEKLLNPRGYIYIECPNAEHYRDVIHAPLQEFNAEHINHFTEVAFRNLMGRFGFQALVTADKIFKIASDQDYHAVYGLFQKQEQVENVVVFDQGVRVAIEDYIHHSNEIMSHVSATLEGLPTDKPIALFGVGQFSFKLLKTEVFKKNEHILLFDNGIAAIGKKVNGVTILPGKDMVDAYKRQSFSIVISSLIHEMPIRQGIEKRFAEAGLDAPQIVGFSGLVRH